MLLQMISSLQLNLKLIRQSGCWLLNLDKHQAWN